MAHRVIERCLRCAESFGHGGDLAHAYCARAETFRLQGAIDSALADLSTAGRVLAPANPNDVCHTSMVLPLQLEQARALGHYDTATALADELIRLSDPSLMSAQIALDQAEYAAQYGLIDDARRFALHSDHLGRTLRSGFFLTRARAILERICEDAVG